MGNFNMLPYEIVLNILIRVPAESVLECKSVSKPWRDVVRHPSFSQMHLNHHLDSGKSGYIFYSHEGGIKAFYYSEYDENCHEAPFHKNTRINLSPPFLDYSFVGSCNGLVCFNGYVVSGLIGSPWNYGSAYICNPITREYVMLPTSKGRNWWIGFGYVGSTNEYKVVRISEPAGRDANVSIVQVYTLGSGNGWRDVGTIDIKMQYMSRFAGANANGAVYWVDRRGSILLAFHLADEKFSQLPPPPPPYLSPHGVPYFFIMLGVLGDSVSAAYNYKAADYDDGDSEIWLLKKNKDNNDLCWSKEFSFDSHILPPFEFTKSGRLLCGGGCGKIYSYNSKASFTRMDVSFGKYVSEAIPHNNTLVSLKALGEKDTKTMESGERASSSSSEETGNTENLKKLRTEVRDL